MNWNEMICDVKVYGLEESIKAAKYPMAVDVSKISSVENIRYWNNHENFLKEFCNYQDNYNKPIGKDTNSSCYFCGSSLNVQKNNKFGHYLCSKHNHQFERYGECFETRPKYEILDDKVVCTIYGERRKERKIFIDAIDIPIIFYSDSVNVGDDGYVKLYHKEDNSSDMLTRVILNINDDSFVADHIDRNPFNNTRKNLRIASYQNNSRNLSLSKNNKSGIIGVSWSSEKEKWRAHIMIDRKQKFLGYYSEKDDAIVARLIAEKEYFKNYSPQKHLFEKYSIEPTDECIYNEDCNKDFNQILRMYKVSKNLANSEIGMGHSNWLKGVVVQFDLKMTPKCSVEMERYHFVDFVSSQSTMHRITKFDLDKSYIKYVDKRCIDVIKEKVADYNAMTDSERNSEQGKLLYLQILYSNPCGFQLTSRMTTNYLQLKTIYAQRRTHRLPEWQAICDWIETLPNSEFITGERKAE